MSVNLSDAELAEASKRRRTVSVCTPSKRCKAGTLRLLPLKLTPMGARPYLHLCPRTFQTCDACAGPYRERIPTCAGGGPVRFYHFSSCILTI